MFIDILMIILIIRSVLVISLSFILTKSKSSWMRNLFVFKYCKQLSNDPWTYRLFGLSALWLIIRYKEGVLQCLGK